MPQISIALSSAFTWFLDTQLQMEGTAAFVASTLVTGIVNYLTVKQAFQAQPDTGKAKHA